MRKLPKYLLMITAAFLVSNGMRNALITHQPVKHLKPCPYRSISITNNLKNKTPAMAGVSTTTFFKHLFNRF